MPDKSLVFGIIARFVQNRTLVPAVQPDEGIGATGLRR